MESPNCQHIHPNRRPQGAVHERSEDPPAWNGVYGIDDELFPPEKRDQAVQETSESHPTVKNGGDQVYKRRGSGSVSEVGEKPARSSTCTSCGWSSETRDGGEEEEEGQSEGKSEKEEEKEGAKPMDKNGEKGGENPYHYVVEHVEDDGATAHVPPASTRQPRVYPWCLLPDTAWYALGSLQLLITLPCTGFIIFTVLFHECLVPYLVKPLLPSPLLPWMKRTIDHLARACAPYVCEDERNAGYLPWMVWTLTVTPLAFSILMWHYLTVLLPLYKELNQEVIAGNNISTTSTTYTSYWFQMGLSFCIYHCIRLGPRYRFFAYHHVLAHKESHARRSLWRFGCPENNDNKKDDAQTEGSIAFTSSLSHVSSKSSSLSFSKSKSTPWSKSSSSLSTSKSSWFAESVLIKNLNGLIGHIFYGAIPFSLRTAHIVFHHYNDKADYTTSADLDRTQGIWSFLLFLPRWFFYYTGVSPIIMFLRRGDTTNALFLSSGILIYCAQLGTVIYCTDLFFACATIIFPFLEATMFMALVVYVWHFCIDPEKPECEYVKSITIIKGRDNIWGEDYHALHHYAPHYHWSELEGRFEATKAMYEEKRATLFTDTEAGEIGMWILLRNFDQLARHFVDLSGRLTHEEKKELLLRRMRYRECPVVE